MLVNVTPEEIKQQYEQKHGRPMQDKDYDAFLRLTDKATVTSYSSGIEYITAILKLFNKWLVI